MKSNSIHVSNHFLYFFLKNFKNRAKNRNWLNPFVLSTFLSTVLIMLILWFILADITMNGWEKLTWEFLSEEPRKGLREGGIFPAIIGTFYLVIVMTILVVPIGVISAIYLHEYAKNGPFTRLIQLAVKNLAGVPAIVFGLFGLGFFIQFLGGGIDRVFYSGELNFGKPAILWSAATLALLTLPVVIVSTEEALRSIPQEIREASYALGATQFQTIWRLIFPNSLSGVLTGSILAVSRGAGEVAPILFTGAAYYLPKIPTELTDQFMELGYHIFIMSTQSPDVDATLPILYTTVFVLLALTFLLNLVSIWVRSQMRARFSRS